jgi:hypothetical protein
MGRRSARFARALSDAVTIHGGLSATMDQLQDTSRGCRSRKIPVKERYHEERPARRVAHAEGGDMTGTCRRCGDDAERSNVVGWCAGCNDHVLHNEARARQEATLTATCAAAVNAPGALDRLTTADAEDDRRIVAWWKASPRMTTDGG